MVYDGTCYDFKVVLVEVGDSVFLKVSPMRGVVRFGKKSKLPLPQNS